MTSDPEEPSWLERARKNCCPGCGFDTVVAGPWGGASRNVFCARCMTRWNFHGISYGIVKVDHEGGCTDADIAYAVRTYPGEQPFRLKDYPRPSVTLR